MRLSIFVKTLYFQSNSRRHHTRIDCISAEFGNLNISLLVMEEIFKVLVFLLAILQLRVNSIGGDRCLTCSDFNRQSNGQQCINSYKDCNGCKPGFVQDHADIRLCYEFEFLATPSDVNSDIGNSIHLPCVFSAMVECYWMKNDHVLTIGEQSRYQYAESSTDEDSRRRDCSLNITDVSIHDTGQWTCGSMTTSEFESIRSEPFSISVTTAITTLDINPAISQLESDVDIVTATAKANGHGDQVTNIHQQTLLSSFNTSFNFIAALFIIMVVVIIGIFGTLIVLCRRQSKYVPNTQGKEWGLESLIGDSDCNC